MKTDNSVCHKATRAFWKVDSLQKPGICICRNMWKLVTAGCSGFVFFCLHPQHPQFAKVKTVPPGLPHDDSF